MSIHTKNQPCRSSRLRAPRHRVVEWDPLAACSFCDIKKITTTPKNFSCMYTQYILYHIVSKVIMIASRIDSSMQITI